MTKILDVHPYGNIVDATLTR